MAYATKANGGHHFPGKNTPTSQAKTHLGPEHLGPVHKSILALVVTYADVLEVGFDHVLVVWWAVLPLHERIISSFHAFLRV